MLILWLFLSFSRKGPGPKRSTHHGDILSHYVQLLRKETKALIAIDAYKRFTFVTLIILTLQCGLTPQEVLNVAWNEIKDRKGKTNNGVFVKQ